MTGTIKEELMRKKGNNFKTKLHGIFQNFLVMNNFYATDISSNIKSMVYCLVSYIKNLKIWFFFPVLTRAKLKGKY